MKNKKIHDLSASSDNLPIDLSTKMDSKQKIVTTFAESQKTLSLDDLSGGKEKYIFVKSSSSDTRYNNLIKGITITILGFVVLAIFSSVNAYFKSKKLKQAIKGGVENTYFSMMEAGKSTSKSDFANASVEIQNAMANFQETQDELWFITKDKTIYGNQQNIQGAIAKILESGEHFLKAGEYFLGVVQEFDKVSIYFISDDEKYKKIKENISLTDLLKTSVGLLDKAITEIEMANDLISQIDETVLPENIRAKVLEAKKQINKTTLTLTDLSGYFPAFFNLLGDEHPHTYMVIMQNNNEIRPTGGFIGSYVLFDVNDGHIMNMTVNDVYDIDGSYGEKITPPDEFLEFTDNWRMRDANYSPDFSVSGAKIAWFLEKEGGPTVDTVIAINQGILYDMLNITGPLKVGDFGEFTADNYNLLLSYVIESKLWGAEDPKHILKVFVEKFKTEIFKEEYLTIVSAKLLRAVQQKHIMFYSKHDEIQAMFEKLQVSGEVRELAPQEDYLSVINISISGVKSEQYIEEYIRHTTSVGEKGDLIDEVVIQRKNQWSNDILLHWLEILKPYGIEDIPSHVIDILGRGENRVLTRVYVPKGSTIISSDVADSEIETKFDEDLNKTYFVYKMEVNPGETGEVRIRYALPFKYDKNDELWEYKLYTEKQPGSRGSIFTKLLEIDLGLEIAGTYPIDLRISKDGDVIYPTNLVYDRYFSALVRQ